MRAGAERSFPIDDAVDAVLAAMAEHGLEPELSACGPDDQDIVWCDLLDRAGMPQADSAGKGGGRQSVASALFEAWEHYWCFNGLGALRDQARAIPIGEVIAQQALAGESMLRRLARDCPGARLACLRFRRLRAGGDGPADDVWYPVFAKNPAFRRFPVPGDDHDVYAPYHRYATGNGSAGGRCVEDALLHALLEVVERDALSFALINWYGNGGGPAYRVDPGTLPEDVHDVFRHASRLYAEPLTVLDITHDLGVPVYCALPPYLLFPQANHFGAGASLSPAYAVDRAVRELTQFTLVNQAADLTAAHRRRLGHLARWPLIARCTEQDPAPVLARAAPARRLGPGEWEGPGGPVRDQLAELVRRLERRGLAAYWLRWDPGTAVPVVCVLVPGLDTFFLARQGVPVLPSGRATGALLATR